MNVLFSRSEFMPSLTKAEQTKRTRRAILDRARHLFTQHGYAATSTEAIINELSITRGALYHHFKGKAQVFEAVVAEANDEIIAYINLQVKDTDNNWERLVIGCQAFLEIAQRDDLRRLIFIEAPAVLDAKTLAKLDQYGFTMLHEGIQLAVDDGTLTTVSAEGFAHLVNGSLNELALWVAQSNDSQRLQTAKKLIETLLLHHKSQDRL